MKAGRHDIPDFWAQMLPEDFEWLRFPDEKLATCDNCYQVAIGEFTQGCQCCTYYPEIPNFMLGMALQDPRSRRHVQQLVADGHGLPIGLVPLPSTMVRAIRAQSTGQFGKERAMVCPFMDPNTTHCQVYSYRNSVCSTFFCSHDHGDAGMAFWGKVQDLVGRVESALAQWVLDEMDFDSKTYMRRLDGWASRLEDVESDGRWSDETRRDIWGSIWSGREIEFYEACARCVESHNGSLFEAASMQPFLEPLAYLRAVQDATPEEYVGAAPRVAEPDDVWPHVEDLWYQVDLEHRKLWSLPIGEGPVRLATDIRIDEHAPTPLPMVGAKQWTARWDDQVMALNQTEATALLLFAEPRAVDERLFAEPAIVELADARASLAKWLRRGALRSTG